MSKKKITDPTASMEELLQRAVQLAEAPFTPDRKSELPSLRTVAATLGTTVIRTRKLLITAGYFTSEFSGAKTPPFRRSAPPGSPGGGNRKSGDTETASHCLFLSAACSHAPCQSKGFKRL